MATISQALTLAREHHRAGRLDLAEEIYRRILAVEPDLAPAHSDLGCILQRQGQLDAAIASYQRALQLAPHLAHAHNNLGEAYRVQGDLRQAETCFRRALALTPDSAVVHGNLGTVLHRRGNLDEAVACYRRGLAIAPGDPANHANLANALKDQGQLAEALAEYRQALALDPAFAAAHSDLLYTMLLAPEFDARAIYEEHRRWNRLHAEPLRRFLRPHANDRSPDRRLRVGYVSPDFGDNPVGRFLLPLLETHDRRAVEVFCYNSNPASDAIGKRCHAAADAWRDVFPLTDEQLAQAVREDQIDILVDLTLHAANSRLLVFARKPAPVQVTYLAYCGTSGLDTIDYRITDPYLDPPGGEPFYSEQPVCLPETYWCYRPLDIVPPVGDLPALTAGHTTFGCLNNFCKVSAPALDLWARLLAAVPASHLLLHAYPGSHCDRVRQGLARHGVAPERVAFVDFLPTDQYFQLYQRIDVALDPFPYGGGTTSCDALWMGVPLVTLIGRTGVGRGGLSILSNLGLAELAAPNPEQYLQIAARLATDRSRLADLRATLRERMQHSPLMNAPRFAHHLETAYRHIWHQWCATPAPP
jgi:predicted O-linked N-acetylglucosamine transferase (SPINDLY family)